MPPSHLRAQNAAGGRIFFFGERVECAVPCASRRLTAAMTAPSIAAVTEDDMKVMVLAYETAEDFARRDFARTDPPAFAAYMAPWKAYTEKLQAAGVLESGGALEGPRTATTLAMRGAEREIADGPFMDAKEQLGGYFILNTKSMEEAVKWAGECPAAATGRAEARLIPDLGAED